MIQIVVCMNIGLNRNENKRERKRERNLKQLKCNKNKKFVRPISSQQTSAYVVGLLNANWSKNEAS